MVSMEDGPKYSRRWVEVSQAMGWSYSQPYRENYNGRDRGLCGALAGECAQKGIIET